MQNALSAASVLLPLTGVFALMARALRRKVRAPAPPPAPRAEMQWPKEPPAPAAPRGPRQISDSHCASCGTSIPGAETLCAWCDPERTGPVPTSIRRSVALSWLVMTVVLGAVFAIGAILAY